MYTETAVRDIMHLLRVVYAALDLYHGVCDEIYL